MEQILLPESKHKELSIEEMKLKFKAFFDRIRGWREW